jgi:hypothetical protein
MLSKKTALIAVIIFTGFAAVYWDLAPEENVLYKENFESDYSTGSDALTCINGALTLDTGSPVYIGGGEWNKTITVPLAKISWQWFGDDSDEFQLWLRLTFSNHKSIYYVAEGSMNPQSEGEFYRDNEGRMRFSPAVVISGIPLGDVKRNVKEDYENYCGSFDNVEIVQVSIGMVDNSALHQNKMQISNLKILK